MQNHYPALNSMFIHQLMNEHRVENSSGKLLKLAVDNNEVTFGSVSSSSLQLSLQTEGSSRLSISASGSVGIGISNPSEKLEVDGTVKAIAFQGNGVALTNVQVPDGSINTVKLANSAITTLKIVDNAVTSTKLADDSVGTSKLANGVIATLKIADNAVTGSKLANSAVTTIKVGNSAISEQKLDASLRAKINNAGVSPVVIRSSANSSDLTTVSRNIASVRITVPGRGIVILTGSGKARIRHQINKQSLAWIGVPDGNSRNSTFIRIPPSSPTGEFYIPFSITNTVSVPGSGTFTFNMTGLKPAGFEQGGGVAITVQEPSLTALFIPG